eukprot:COSAG06_NODE_1883_length_8145_cov_21.194009_8_plen_68_part_00
MVAWELDDDAALRAFLCGQLLFIIIHCYIIIHYHLCGQFTATDAKHNTQHTRTAPLFGVQPNLETES